MTEVALKIEDGPQKPELMFSLSQGERVPVLFRTNGEAVECVITRMEEREDGFTFAIRGTIASGAYAHSPFSGLYSVSERAGELRVDA